MVNPNLDLVVPDWPAPPCVRAVTTTRQGGVSAGVYAALNLATHVGDNPEHVAANRAALRAWLSLPAEPTWLAQVHGTRVVDAGVDDEPPEADASVADRPGVVCAVLTADCLPVLLCTRDGARVAVAHAGWRGLAAGVLETTVRALGGPPGDVMAWLGPGIGPDAYEVGPEVRQAFVSADRRAAQAFARGRRADRWLADMYALACLRLDRVGVTAVYGGGLCTFREGERFFSYRRDGATGRMATLAWLEPQGLR